MCSAINGGVFAGGCRSQWRVVASDAVGGGRHFVSGLIRRKGNVGRKKNGSALAVMSASDVLFRAC
jgi:hypothetical protein